MGALTMVSPFAPITVCAADGDHVFTVTEGASPWLDRVGQWALTSVPETLKGSNPLPQGDCSSRSLDVQGKPKSITIGVQTNDVAKFKEKFTTAKETEDQIAVKNPEGVVLPYTIFALPDPPAKIDGAGVFGAGLLLLKMEGGEPAAGASPSGSAAPAASPHAVLKQPRPFELGEKTKLHLYLLIGQSNMVGRDTAGIESQPEDPNLGYLGGDDSHWFVAREPMHSGGSGIGPGITFAGDMLKAGDGIKIGLVPCAVGGTPLSRWVKGGDLYVHALKRARVAMKVGELKGVLWHQGESDSNAAELAQSYETRLVQMFRDLREDLGMADLPIVVGQLGEFVQGSYVGTVRTAIERVPASLPHVGLADSAGLKDKGDHLHFSAAAQQEFGHRYAAAMQELQKTTGS